MSFILSQDTCEFTYLIFKVDNDGHIINSCICMTYLRPTYRHVWRVVFLVLKMWKSSSGRCMNYLYPSMLIGLPFPVACNLALQNVRGI